jgi:hypothetical protein
MIDRSPSLLVLALTTTALAACQVSSLGGGSTGSGGSTSTGTNSAGSGGAAPTATTSGAGGGPTGAAFQLVAARWTGSAEAVDRIDPLTGAATFLGNLGDLELWSTELVLDRDATHVYAVGMPASKVSTLYVLDLATGASTQAPIAHDYVLGGVTDDGHAIGVYWTGSAEAVDLVDPATGSGAFAGNLGDLQTWSTQLAYDHAAHVLHAIGNDTLGTSQLFSLSLDTHTTVKVPVSTGYFLGGVTPAGGIVGALWTGTFERVDVIDPATGAGNGQGKLGDLETWSSGALAYDATTNVAYALGNAAGKVPEIYALDLASHASTGVATLTDAQVVGRP